MGQPLQSVSQVTLQVLSMLTFALLKRVHNPAGLLVQACSTGQALQLSEICADPSP